MGRIETLSIVLFFNNFIYFILQSNVKSNLSSVLMKNSLNNLLDHNQLSKRKKNNRLPMS